MNIVVVSGGFDPIHSGHLAYFKAAKSLGDYLIVALNSDKWLEKKKTKFFMPFHERESIIKNLVMVNEVISFEDDEQGSCCNALEKIKIDYPNDEIIFANGSIDFFLASSTVVNNNAAAPSFIPDEFPGVTVPLFKNTVFNFCKSDFKIPFLGCSSLSIIYPF